MAPVIRKDAKVSQEHQKQSEVISDAPLGLRSSYKKKPQIIGVGYGGYADHVSMDFSTHYHLYQTDPIVQKTLLKSDEKNIHPKEQIDIHNFSYEIPEYTLFVGRKDLLSRLEECFAVSESKKEKTTPAYKLPKVVLTGLSGIGKTHLASYYANSTKKYYKRQFFFPAHDEDALIAAYRVLAKKEKIFEEDVDLLNEVTDETIKEKVVQWFSDQTNWLIIYDNFRHFFPKEFSSNESGLLTPQYNDINRFISFLPNEGTGNILITSTMPEKEWRKDFLVLPVEALSPADAVKLVIESTKTEKKDDPNIEKLTKMLGCLPLALAQASQFIRETEMDVSEYIEQYRKERIRFLNKYMIPPELRSHESVFFTFTFNINSIEKEEEIDKNKMKIPDNEKTSAKRLLQACSYLHSRNIPFSFLECWHKKSYPNLAESRVKELIGKLSTYSLIQLDKKNNCIHVHRLIQAILLSENNLEANNIAMLLGDIYNHSGNRNVIQKLEQIKFVSHSLSFYSKEIKQIYKTRKKISEEKESAELVGIEVEKSEEKIDSSTLANFVLFLSNLGFYFSGSYNENRSIFFMERAIFFCSEIVRLCKKNQESMEIRKKLAKNFSRCFIDYSLVLQKFGGKKNLEKSCRYIEAAFDYESKLTRVGRDRVEVRLQLNNYFAIIKNDLGEFKESIKISEMSLEEVLIYLHINEEDLFEKNNLQNQSKITRIINLVKEISSKFNSNEPFLDGLFPIFTNYLISLRNLNKLNYSLNLIEIIKPILNTFIQNLKKVNYHTNIGSLSFIVASILTKSLGFKVYNKEKIREIKYFLCASNKINEISGFRNHPRNAAVFELFCQIFILENEYKNAAEFLREAIKIYKDYLTGNSISHFRYRKRYIELRKIFKEILKYATTTSVSITSTSSAILTKNDFAKLYYDQEEISDNLKPVVFHFANDNKRGLSHVLNSMTIISPLPSSQLLSPSLSPIGSPLTYPESPLSPPQLISPQDKDAIGGRQPKRPALSNKLTENKAILLETKSPASPKLGGVDVTPDSSDVELEAEDEPTKAWLIPAFSTVSDMELLEKVEPADTWLMPAASEAEVKEAKGHLSIHVSSSSLSIGSLLSSSDPSSSSLPSNSSSSSSSLSLPVASSSPSLKMQKQEKKQVAPGQNSGAIFSSSTAQAVTSSVSKPSKMPIVK